MRLKSAFPAAAAMAAAAMFLASCIAPTFKLITDKHDPLREKVLEGSGSEKVLVIPVSGVISDMPDSGSLISLASRPSMVEEIVSQLRLASASPETKAVVLKVDSPGGTATASDVLYHELMKFKKATGKKIVVSMMNIATSGGYYVSLPADHITAHPTTVTGSVGVVFMHPKIHGLMDKLGIQVEASKSGKNKDMGSPFRKTTPEENKLFQALIDQMADRFAGLVAQHRKLEPKAMAEVRKAGVYTADDAKKLGLIDEVCYLDQALLKAKELSGLPPNAKVVIYRRSEYPNDNIYNTARFSSEIKKPSLVSLGPVDELSNCQTGFYYMWVPASLGN